MRRRRKADGHAGRLPYRRAVCASSTAGGIYDNAREMCERLRRRCEGAKRLQRRGGAGIISSTRRGFAGKPETSSTFATYISHNSVMGVTACGGTTRLKGPQDGLTCEKIASRTVENPGCGSGTLCGTGPGTGTLSMRMPRPP